MIENYIYENQKDLNKNMQDLYKRIESNKFVKDLYDLHLGFFRFDKEDLNRFEYILGGICSSGKQCELTEEDIRNIWFGSSVESVNLEWLLPIFLKHYWNGIGWPKNTFEKHLTISALDDFGGDWDDANDWAKEQVYENKEYNRRRMVTKKKLTLIIKLIFKHLGIKESIRAYSKSKGYL